MRNLALTVGGVVLIVAGVIFGLQGFGVIGGGFMSGNSVWAVIGPVVAVIGLLLALAGLRLRRSAS